MPTDPTAATLERAVRQAQARIARHRAPDARSWESNPALTVEDLSEILSAAATTVRPQYQTVTQFVDGFIATYYWRQVRDSPIRAWCPDWETEHPEVRFRFELLWQMYEQIKATGGDARAMSDFMLDHLARHMEEIFDTRGPLQFCSYQGGHKSSMTPMHGADGVAGTATKYPTLTAARVA